MAIAQDPTLAFVSFGVHVVWCWRKFGWFLFLVIDLVYIGLVIVYTWYGSRCMVWSVYLTMGQYWCTCGMVMVYSWSSYIGQFGCTRGIVCMFTSLYILCNFKFNYVQVLTLFCLKCIFVYS